MPRIRLHLGNLNITELVALGQRVHAAMSDNSDFAPLSSQVTGLLDEIEELSRCNESYKAAFMLAQERLAEQQSQRSRLEKLLNELANGVEISTATHASMLASAGFDVPLVSTMSGLLRPPQRPASELDGAAVTR